MIKLSFLRQVAYSCRNFNRKLNYGNKKISNISLDSIYSQYTCSMCVNRIFSRNLYTSSKFYKDSNDKQEYADDPEVKNLLLELRRDFTVTDTQGEDIDAEENKDGDNVINQENTLSDSSPDSDSKKSDVNTDSGSDIKSNSKVKEEPVEPDENVWSQFSKNKYDSYVGKSTRVIYDYHEEQQQKLLGIDIPDVKKKEVPALKRGITGVFDLKELLDLIRKQNVLDIAVVKIPEEYKFVNYLVIGTCKNIRHTKAISEIIKRAYNAKKKKKDPFIIIEGKETEWVAIDLINIAIHLMSEKTRYMYDMETLWTVGKEFDDLTLETTAFLNSSSSEY